MNNEQSKSIERIEREKAAFLYSSALEHGDFETVASILEQAQKDAVLEGILLEINDALGHESETGFTADAVFADEADRVGQILRECLPSGMVDAREGDLELPSLTIRRVLMQMQGDSSLNTQLRQEAASLQDRLQEDVALPSDLSQGSVQRVFNELRLSAGESLQKLFRQAAIFLAMGREQGMTQLAAARRERGKKKQGRVDEGEK